MQPFSIQKPLSVDHFFLFLELQPNCLWSSTILAVSYSVPPSCIYVKYKKYIEIGATDYVCYQVYLMFKCLQLFFDTVVRVSLSNITVDVIINIYNLIFDLPDNVLESESVENLRGRAMGWSFCPTNQYHQFTQSITNIGNGRFIWVITIV